MLLNFAKKSLCCLRKIIVFLFCYTGLGSRKIVNPSMYYILQSFIWFYGFSTIIFIKFLFLSLQRGQQSIPLHHQQNATGWTDAIPDRGPDVQWSSSFTQLLQGPLLRHDTPDQTCDKTSGKSHGKIRFWRQCKYNFFVQVFCTSMNGNTYGTKYRLSGDRSCRAI